MKASEIIKRLQQLVTEHGNMDVYLDTDAFGLADISEIDIDAEDEAIIIWKEQGDDQCVAGI